MRLDRWLRLHVPGLTQGRIEKLLRTGWIRLDGKRVKAGHRLAAGQIIRLPPLTAPPPRPRPAPRIAGAEAQRLRARVLHRDAGLIALDKPPGLAVQGGSRLVRHLDAMLDALRFGAQERPRLVHRLDKETSGVLLLARTRSAAVKLAESFRKGRALKLYWGLTLGVPSPAKGEVILPIARKAGETGAARAARTSYQTLARAGRRFALVAFQPATGRTHQIRIHAAQAGAPLLGDRKYGGPAAAAIPEGFGRGLHLYARSLEIPHPETGRPFRILAPLPPHMETSCRFLDFQI